MTAPTLPPAVAVPFSDDELSALDLAPVARAFKSYEDGRTALPTLAGSLEQDRYLSPEGRQAKLTAEGIKPIVADMVAGIAKLDEVDALLASKLEARVAKLQSAAAPVAITDGRKAELVAVAQAFRALPRSEQVRRQAAAQREADPDRETLEMMQHVSPTVWGGTSIMQDMARGHGQPAIEADAEVTRLVGLLDTSKSARAQLIGWREALVASGDYTILQKEGLVDKRRQDMTSTEKSDYIDAHGLDAFKALRA